MLSTGSQRLQDGTGRMILLGLAQRYGINENYNLLFWRWLDEVAEHWKGF